MFGLLIIEYKYETFSFYNIWLKQHLNKISLVGTLNLATSYVPRGSGLEMSLAAFAFHKSLATIKLGESFGWARKNQNPESKQMSHIEDSSLRKSFKNCI